MNNSEFQDDDELGWERLKDTEPPAELIARLHGRLADFHPDRVPIELRRSKSRKSAAFLTVFLVTAASAVIAACAFRFFFDSPNATIAKNDPPNENVSEQDSAIEEQLPLETRNQLLIASYNSTSLAPPKLVNGNLEELRQGKFAVGWQFRATSKHFQMNVFEDTASRNHFVRIECGKKLNADHFGNVMQTIEAEPFLNQRVVFSAKVRGRDLGHHGSVHLWLRVDGMNGRGEIVPLTFDNMSDRAVHQPDWVECSIVSDVPSNATHINVGAFLMRGGIAEIDDFKLVRADEGMPVTAPLLQSSELAMKRKERFVTLRSPTQEEPKIAVTEGPKTSLINGSFELSTDDQPTAGWQLYAGGAEAKLDSEETFHGSKALKLSSEAKRNDSQFTNVSQSFPAKQWHNKTLRFRAGVKVKDKSSGVVQLWLRGDGISVSGATHPVVFDNMQDRPIRSSLWKHYDIIVKIPAETKSIVLGVLFIGEGTAWIDDCSLETVESHGLSNTRNEEPIAFVVVGVSLAILGLLLSIWAHQAESRVGQPFSLRFACVYWLLYTQASVLHVFPFTGLAVGNALAFIQDRSVRWFAKNALGIERELIGPNGSGDTTHDFIRLLLLLFVSLGIGAVWTALSRKSTWDRRLKDLFQSMLRYTLALSLIGYGLAKMTKSGNQFPEPGIEQLLKTWGDSSPMNLIWTMMGSSQSYNFFAGATEVAASLLLIWRRSAWLGAALSAGIMLNVFMINMCYDVPVKQYSFHLLAIGIQLVFADLRWAQLILLNRQTQTRDLSPDYQSKFFEQFHRAIKAWVVVVGFAIPIAMAAYQNWTYRAALPDNQIFGAYRVEQFEIENTAESDNARMWQNVILREIPGTEGRPGYSRMQIYWVKTEAIFDNVASKESFTVVLNPAESTISIPKEQTELHYVLDGNKAEWTGSFKGKQVHIKLQRITRNDFLLVNRGFRWVNEIPFNR